MTSDAPLVLQNPAVERAKASIQEWMESDTSLFAQTKLEDAMRKAGVVSVVKTEREYLDAADLLSNVRAARKGLVGLYDEVAKPLMMLRKLVSVPTSTAKAEAKVCEDRLATLLVGYKRMREQQMREEQEAAEKAAAERERERQEVARKAQEAIERERAAADRERERQEAVERERERREAAEKERLRREAAEKERNILAKKVLEEKQAAARERETQQAADRERERQEFAELEALEREAADRERERKESERPVEVNRPMPPAVTPGVVKERTNWIAFVSDWRLYVQGVLDGKVPMDGLFGLQPDEKAGGLSSVWLRKQARDCNGVLSYPGVECFNDKIVIT